MRKLEDLLNLDPIEKVTESPKIDAAVEAKKIEDTRLSLAAADSAIDKIDHALPVVTGLDTSESELDEVATLATSTFEDLIELSKNVEARFSGPIIQSASTILGHALNARIAKVDKRLKIIDLQLKKARLDKMTAKEGAGDVDTPIDGTGTVIDRNELLKEILANHTSGAK